MGCADEDIIDGKAEVSTPEGAKCYLLEVNREGAGGADLGETYHCVDEAEWDKNRMGSEWVDASGKRK